MRYVFFLLFFSVSCFNLGFAKEELGQVAPKNVVSLEKIVVFGIRPGPKLWKVSKGEHVLWVMGTLNYLPKHMKWYSSHVSEVIAQSQAFLLPPGVTAEIGFFKGLSLATSAIGIKKNPDKKKLINVVPAKDYARWLALKEKYIGRDRGVEKLRPIFAAMKLFDKAIKKVGLVDDTKVEKKVRKLAKKNKLEFIKPFLTIDLNKPKAALKKFKKTEISDLECFTKTLTRTETDLILMKQRAYAWADGDISQLKALAFSGQNKACTSALLNNEIAQDVGMVDLPVRLRKIWLEKAEEALTKHNSSFAIMPVYHLLGENSYLNDLAKRGYTITAPK